MYALGVLAFFGAALLALFAAGGYIVERRHINRSLRSVRTIELAPLDLRRQELAAPVRHRLVIPGVRWLGRIARRLTPQGLVERLRKEVLYAGSPSGWDAERIAASKVVVAGLLAMGTLFLAWTQKSGPLRALILSLLLAFVGYYLPDWVLRSRARQRQDALRRALPDSLDLLTITVEAGLGFDAAISRVSRQVGGPLGEELHRMVQEMQLGKNRADAFRDLADRSPAPELKSFALAMVQADVFGISVGKVLQVQSVEMRLKRRQLAEERAQKIPVKIIFPLLLCIFPALFVVLLGPAAITIYEGLFQLR